MREPSRRVRLPFYPPLSRVRALLGVLGGVARARLRALSGAIEELTGTPQKPVDWSQPEAWIRERLTGDEAELASTIWEGSGRRVNPRHLTGALLVINHYELATL